VFCRRIGNHFAGRQLFPWSRIRYAAVTRSQESRSGKVISEADGTVEKNWIGFVDTMIQYYLHINPDELTDEQWAEKFAQLMEIRKKEFQPGNPLR